MDSCFQDFHFDGAGATTVDKLVYEGIVTVINRLGGALPDDFALVDHGDVIGDLAG